MVGSFRTRDFFPGTFRHISAHPGTFSAVSVARDGVLWHILRRRRRGGGFDLPEDENEGAFEAPTANMIAPSQARATPTGRPSERIAEGPAALRYQIERCEVKTIPLRRPRARARPRATGT
jgi:hypothetical protein